MTARSGRELLIKKNGTAIAGLRSTSVSFTSGGVDVTDKLDGGYRTMADFSGQQSFDVTASGVAKGVVIRDIFKAGTGYLVTDVTVVWDTGEEWAVDLWIESYTETGEHNGEVTFDVTMQSSGAWAEVV